MFVCVNAKWSHRDDLIHPTPPLLPKLVLMSTSKAQNGTIAFLKPHHQNENQNLGLNISCIPPNTNW